MTQRKPEALSQYNVVITTIPNKRQRYRTIGDWFKEDNGTLRINVSATGRKDYEFLTALHEMIEQYLCEKDGITEQQVDSWDLLHENEDEPGEMLHCPYREQHLFAEAVEKVVAGKIGVDWVKYGIALESAMNDKSTAALKSPGKYILHPKPSRQALMVRTRKILEEQEG